MKTGYVVSVVGASRDLGREVRRVLADREFPVSEWRLHDTEGNLGAGEDDEVGVTLIETADMRGVDLVFMCASETLTAQWITRSVDANCVVIDLTQLRAEEPSVPLVVPEVNPETLAEYRQRRIVTNPVAGATALALTLKPLDAFAHIKRVVVSSYESVSQVGAAAIEELSRQSVDLMSGRSVDPEVFPHRIGFNLLPQVGEFLAGGQTRGELLIEAQVRRLLDVPDLPITVTSVRIPVFYGQGFAVNIETEQPLSAETAHALLREAPGVALIDEVAENEYPTLASAIGNDDVFVGRVREDTSVEHGLNLWLTIDEVAKGGAVNAVQIAEILVRDYLDDE